MDNNILKLYPQFTQLTDRRQQKQPVDLERRSGEDRRQSQRVGDPKLNTDVDKIQDTFKAFIHNTDQFQSSVNRLDNTALKNKEVTKAVFAALSPIVPVRRISSLPDNIEDHNYIRAAGILGLMAINLPEDGRDLKDAWNQLRGKYNKKYNYKESQHTFSFFKGTWLEWLLKLPGKLGKNLSEKLQKADKSLYETKFGEFLSNIFNIELDGKPINIGKVYGRNKKILAYTFKGTKTSKLVGRALLRIPVISVIVLGALELPAIFKSFNNSQGYKNKIKSGFKQIAKSAVYITSTVAGIGLAGAILARKGPIGSLTGMGIGAVAGSNISGLINKQIDKV